MTDAELVVLSLVAERPRHGYDVESTIVERNMREWTAIGFSSIYYLLEKLQAAGLVTSVRARAPGRGPARRVYSATEEGSAVLHGEALQAIANPAQPSSRFLLALAALPLLDDDEVADAIADRRQHLEARLETLTERRASDEMLAEHRSGLPIHVAAMFDLSAAQITAELEWVRRFATNFDRR